MPEPVLPGAFLQYPLAHRGLHDATGGTVENSPSAIRAAVAHGYGIEVDVQASRDGRAMVFHDRTLERLTGENGNVRDRDAAALETIPLTGSADEIPSLKSVLELVAGRVPLLVEIKDQDGAMGPIAGDLARAVADDLRSYTGPVAVMSFNPYEIDAFGTASPGTPRGLVTDPFQERVWPEIPAARRAELAEVPDFDRIGASFISHNRRDLASALVAAFKSRGVPVLTWTVRSQQEEAEARKIADNITFEGYLPAKQH